MAMATTLLLTYIDREVEGDVIFPEISENEFYIENSTHYPDGTEPFTVVTYRRRTQLSYPPQGKPAGKR